MNHKPRRRRGVVLTPQGLEKLQAAKSQMEWQGNSGNRYTLEVLSDHLMKEAGERVIASRP